MSFVTATSAADVLTLEKAVGTALEQNRSLLGATHELEAARWGKLSSYSTFLPTIAVSSNFTRIDPETELRANAALDFIKASAGALGIPQSALSNLKPFAYRDSYSTDITVIQPVYNGGAEIVGLHAADATRDRSEYSYQDTEQDVIASVKISYLSVLKAGKTRLRPIIMTTATMIFGMMRLALALGAGSEMRQGMAIVVIGGLTSSTLLTLVLIPVVYTYVDELREKLPALFKRVAWAAKVPWKGWAVAVSTELGAE